MAENENENENVDVESPEGEVPEAAESEAPEASEAPEEGLILALRPSRQRNCRPSSVRNVQAAVHLPGWLPSPIWQHF